MKITKTERNISALILIPVLTILILFKFPGIIGASDAVIGSGATESEINRGELLFMETASPQNINIGETAGVNYQVSENYEILLIRNVVDSRQENNTREFGIRDINNQETIWINEDSIVQRSKLSIPFAGYIVQFTNTVIGRILLIGMPLTVIVYYEIGQISESIEAGEIKWR